MTDAPSPDAPPPARPAGTPRAGAVPRVETVRVTAPDLARRAAMERTRNRLVCAAGGFALLFGAVAAKLADATILFPILPKPAKIVQVTPPADPGGAGPGATDQVDPNAGPHVRAMITDRNGEIMAISLQTAALIADPRQIIDAADVAKKIKSVLPRLDQEKATARLSAEKKDFVYLARRITPREQIAINNLGIPGISFEPTEVRRYPLGRVAAQVLGGVDVDSHGVAGVERAFDKRLRTDATPLHLSIDVRVQAVMRDELSQAMDEFQAIGACGIVMDVRTGEVIAMVSLPDYDANQFGKASAEERFNRAVTGMYEPGSTFKLQTAAMALDAGAVHIWDMFDAAHDIKVGRFTISDFEGKHRWLYLPEVLAYSSNLGAAHVAVTAGTEHQRAWLKNMGMFNKIGIQLPEAGLPIVPPAANWKELTTMTVGFGHGIAVSPLHVVRGTAAVANGGIKLTPTIEELAPGAAAPEGERIMQQANSDTIRKLMRLVVTEGYGKPADVPGYYVGGKTGTAEKVGRGGYQKHTNVSAFISVFPMNAPRYAVYFMLDSPHGNKSTGGFSTAGAVSAPGAGKVIARIAPMLGLFPDIADKAAIEQSLYIPLQPGRPAGARALGPGSAPPQPAPAPHVPGANAPIASGPRAPHPREAAAPEAPAMFQSLRREAAAHATVPADPVTAQ
jgi:cell division protein FtsI (penicillin-binding protein 3)